MTRLVWGLEEQRRYEAGVDRGVLYPPDAPGVVWNGLVSVDETFTGGEVQSLHYDGIKYLDYVSPKNYQATLTAFRAPEEFEQFVGRRPLVPGLIFTRQPRQRFGLSYRTLLEDNLGYRLHLVYNALASPSSRGYRSLSPNQQADTVSWKIDAVPPRSNTHKPSAHYIFDSTKSDPIALGIIESYLYGTDNTDPRLPDFEELIDIIVVGELMIIVPDEVGGLASLFPGDGDLYRTSREGILRALPTTRLLESSVDGLYTLE